ncbi:glycosyltransferase [Magnetospirillum moscoviense]|uniref:Glycosyltransferase 2-like domain-containing protein n=1 Tax=Magnetospirillum moscoviense TaxID=1437059 RepID=A0A178MZ19_9PROT|nr:glycosyltransferase [Magnetospirillum moscoviense]OAN55104.1 hypothetical protein A6A05_00655 [Magnetospirillum moscoviense]
MTDSQDKTAGPQKRQRTLVFTATYNERSNIDILLQRIFAAGPEFDVLVVDDNSTDGTGRHLEELAKADPRIHVVHRPAKLGLGTAHQLGMVYAVQYNYDRLVTMDADLSHDPASIPALLEQLEQGADLVIGSRYAPGGSSDYEGYRRFISVSANTLARLLLGIPLHEFTTSFRAFRVDMLRSRRCAKLKAGGYSYFMETVYRLHRAGFQVAEVPIQFRDRHSGVSKIPKFEVFRGIAKLMHLAGSRMIGRPSVPAVNIESRCSGCGSTYLMQYHAPSTDGDGGAEAYRCSSMGHASKPQVALCLHCGLMQVPPEAQPANLDDLYADVEDPLYLQNAKAREITFERLFDRIEQHLGAKGRLLEVGAYCGLFLEVAARRGWSVEGIEPSRWASGIAVQRTGAKVHQGTVETAWEALSPPYDVVVAWDVLEHLREPYAFLAQANGLLKENGILCFSTLDAAALFPQVMGRRWPWLMDMHLYYFTRPLLRRWLLRAGFAELFNADYRHYTTIQYLWHKIVALLPGPLGAVVRPVGAVLPTRWAVPISLGDVVLFGARKIDAPAPGPLAESILKVEVN